MIVAKRISFDAAHFLPDYDGPCANMHGHRWTVEVGVEGPIFPNGMVLDFVKLKAFLEVIKKAFDHQLINDILPNPTAENICVWVRIRFYEWVSDYDKKQELKLAFIKVWETDDSYVELREDPEVCLG